MRRFVIGMLVLISVVCLLLSSTSLWTRRHVVNTDVFVATAEQVIGDPAVETRITTRVVDAIMASPNVLQAIDQGAAALPPGLQIFRPSIDDGVRILLTRGVGALLTSQVYNDLVRAALTSAHTQLVNGQPVTFNLGQAKALIPPERRTGFAGQVINLVPNDVGITVLSKEQNPRAYTTIDLLKSLWLWVGLGALGTLAGALVLSDHRRRTLRAWAIGTVVAGLLLNFVLTAARGPFLAGVQPVNVAAADVIYGTFIEYLRTWTFGLVAIAAGIALVTWLWGRVGILPGITRGYRATRTQAARYRQSRDARRVAATEAGIPEQPGEPWSKRFSTRVSAFADGLEWSDRLVTLADLVRRNLRIFRWGGIAIGALVLLFWPEHTLSVVIWITAAVALYLGLIELLVSLGARAHPARPGTAPPEPSPAAPPASVTPPIETTAPETPRQETEPQIEPKHPPTQATEEEAIELPRTPEPRVSAEPHAAEEDLVVHGARRWERAKEELSTIDRSFDLLMRLGDIRKAGLLTDEEFTQEKARLLGF